MRVPFRQVCRCRSGTNTEDAGGTMLRIVYSLYGLSSQPVLLTMVHTKAGMVRGILLQAILSFYPFLVAVHGNGDGKLEHGILEHLEQGIALLDSTLNIVFANNRFERLFHLCFGTDNKDVLPGYIRNLDARKRAVFRIDRNKGAQFFMVIKTFMVANNKVYLLTLNKRRLRKIDLFKILQSEHKVSLEQFRIITYLGKGFNNNEIAQLCNMKTCNVKYHLSHLYDKFYVSNRTEFLNKIKEIENGLF